MALTIGALVSAMPSTPAWAWGAEGHEIIAAVALRHINPAARHQAADLLEAAGLRPFISVAPWADEYRFMHPESEPWHFVDIPVTTGAFDSDRDCHGDGHGHRVATETCVVAKIVDFTMALADRTRSPAERGQALAFVIHFVGDVHQPLHSADRDDRGGNAIRITFNGQETDEHGHPRNLHAAWDTYMIKGWYGRVEAQSVAAALDAGQRAPTISLANLRQEAVSWAEEAHQYAVSTAYGALTVGPTPDIGIAYETAAKPVIDRQLEVAGLRLAGVINAALQQ